jgi:hypothetical protein
MKIKKLNNKQKTLTMFKKKLKKRLNKLNNKYLKFDIFCLTKFLNV